MDNVQEVIKCLNQGKISRFNAYEQIDHFKFMNSCDELKTGKKNSGSIYSRTFMYDEKYMKAHVIFGKQVLLGVTHCSMAIDALSKLFSNSEGFEIQKFMFLNPVIIEKGETAEVLIHAEKRENGYECVNSFATGTNKDYIPSVSYLATEGAKINKTYFSIADKIKKCDRVVDKEYTSARWMMSRPEILSAVEYIHIGKECAIGEMILSQSARLGTYGYSISPAFIDGGFCVASALLPDEILIKDDSYGMYVPFMIKSIKVCGTISDTCYCISKVKKCTDQILVVDYVICDEKGKTVVEVEDFSLKFAQNNEFFHKKAEKVEKMEQIEANKLSSIDKEDLWKLVAQYLAQKVAYKLEVAPNDISYGKNFMELGLDSNVLISLTSKIEDELGTELYPTLFFEYQNISEMTDYFMETYKNELQRYFGDVVREENVEKYTKEENAEKQPEKIQVEKEDVRSCNDIAIIGMSGKYAESGNLEEFWDNLLSSKDMISEIPQDHWDYRRSYDEDRNRKGKNYCKWGSFIEVDKFDAEYFDISPREARWMDPQLRLLLEAVQDTVDDAGYGKKIYNTNTGIFVGSGLREYWENIVRDKVEMKDYESNSAVFSSLAGRVSYVYDLQGPSMVLDTACSSSLSAIHLACSAIKNRDCDMCFVAGLNLLLSDLHYIYVSRMQALSPTGRCHTFDKDADGYVPGEGIGVVLLKPLEKSIADGDQIYGVIKGTAVNHVGKSNNPSAPRTELQTKLLLQAWENAQVSPESISYIEAHGTGTLLGDPIEINAMKKAFEEKTQAKHFCTLGSAKSHIGHLGGAAGITGVIKTVLSMKNGKIPVMPQFHELNPYIDLNDSPFLINRETIQWERKGNMPRRAGVSSFGITGSNAHVVLEEYINQPEWSYHSEKGIFVLSAKNDEKLREYAQRFLNYFEKDVCEERNYLDGILYNLQTGRKELEYRLAIVTSSKEQLVKSIKNYLDKVHDENVVYSKRDDVEILECMDDNEFLSGYSNNRHLVIAESWCKGVRINWDVLYDSQKMSRISLPTYPYKKDVYWREEIKEELNKELNEELNEDIKEAIELENSIRLLLEKNSEKVSYVKVGLKEEEIKEEKRPTNILVFARNFETELELNKRYQNGKFVIVKAGEYYDYSEQGFVIRPREKGDYEAMVEQLLQINFTPEIVVHEWLCDSKFMLNNDRIQDIYDMAMDYGVNSIFHFAKVIKKEKLRPTRIVTFFGGNFPYVHPGCESIAGFCNSLDTQFQGVFYTAVKLCQCDKLYEIMAREMVSNDNVHHNVYYKNNTRYVYGYCLQDRKSDEPIALKRNGTYIITGGAGGIGFELARHFSKTLNARVVITGRSPKNKLIEDKISGNKTEEGVIEYYSCDVTDYSSMETLFQQVKKKYGAIHGIFHAAGTFTEKSIMQKELAEFQKLMLPKTKGAMVLSMLCSRWNVEFVVGFSSASSILGDFGQCDYAIANRFMDSLFIQQNKLPETKTKFVIINWPLWRDGAMHSDMETEEMYLKSSGMSYLETKDGVEALENILGKGHLQTMVLAREESDNLDSKVKVVTDLNANFDQLSEMVQTDLINQVSRIIGLKCESIELNKSFGTYGFDSLCLKELAESIGDYYQIEIPATVFFSKSTVAKLSAYLLEEFEEVRDFYEGNKVSEISSDVHMLEAMESTIQNDTVGNRKQEKENYHEEIAIIGMDATFPGADNTDEFWKNLMEHRNVITEIPEERWNGDDYYSPEYQEGKTNSKWGAFVEKAACFDAAFFHISPRDAELMDPQQRMFIESAWKVVENAGYKMSDFAGSKMGVFTGIQSSDYTELLVKNGYTQAQIGTGNAHALTPNHVSYLFDFHGPSEAIDTACSSALVAVHRAAQSILNGECDTAIAGGVSLLLSPYNYQITGQMGILSSDGKCKTFDKKANGYVRGEGCGTVLLKPLQKAIEDGDHIYGVIAASSINHGGKANSLTAPNPDLQAELIADAIKKAGIHPEDMVFIETHGTGTELGDPVEVEGLKKAFKQSAKQWGKPIQNNNYCGLSAVKTNIGHLEAAAGIAGLIKLLLAFKHKMLPANMNFTQQNPLLDMDASPFYVVTKNKELINKVCSNNEKKPLYAGVSAFGFGGSNAHMIIREYVDLRSASDESNGEKLILLSAMTKAQLKTQAVNLLNYMDEKDIKLDDIAYTLLVGRERMKESVIFAVSSLNELRNRLSDYINVVNNNAEYQDDSNKWSSDVDAIERAKNGRRIELPLYPFIERRFWFDDCASGENKKNINIMKKPFTEAKQEKSNVVYGENCSGDVSLAIKRLHQYEATYPMKFCDEVKLEIIDGSIAYVKIDDLKNRNMFSSYVISGLLYQFDQIKKNPNIKVIVLSGTDNVFCMGGTQEQLMSISSRKGNFTDVPFLYSGLLELDLPVISAMQGHASGGGMIFGLLADIVILSDESVYSASFMKYGFTPGMGATYVLKERFGGNIATEMMFTAKSYTGEELQQRGASVLVKKKADVVNEAVKLARSLSKKNLNSLKVLKRELANRILVELPDIIDRELKMHDKTFHSDEVRQAIDYYYCGKDEKKEHVAPKSVVEVKNKLEESSSKVVESEEEKLSKVKSKLISICAKIVHIPEEELDEEESFRDMGIDSISGVEIVRDINNVFGTELEAVVIYDYSNISLLASHILEENGFVTYSNKPEEVRNTLPMEDGKVISGKLTSKKEKVSLREEQTQKTTNTMKISLSRGCDEEIPQQRVLLRMGNKKEEQEKLSSEKNNLRNASAPYERKNIENKREFQNFTYHQGLNRSDEVKKVVCDIIGNILHMSCGELDESISFREMGVDSISGVEIVRDINRVYDTELEAVIIYDYPTINKLSQYIAKIIPEREETEGFFGEASQKESKSLLEEKIAIVGISGKFPDALSVEEYWENLRVGKDCIHIVPKERFDIKDCYSENLSETGKTNGKWMGAIPDIDKFDAGFFNISPREAAMIDPQHRLFLEEAWKALEDAGYPSDKLSEKKCGVFVGASKGDYEQYLLDSDEKLDSMFLTGTYNSFLAARISYFLNIKGPNMVIDTACSSSLVAIHEASNSILLGESEIALAGGVSLMTTPYFHVTAGKGEILSPDGVCRPFDDFANGMVPGEAVAVLVLKKLSDAIEDKDHIYGVICGSAVNQDGKTNGIAAPSTISQTELEQEVYDKANINPEEISYVETHGTGTKLGDPIEVTALKNAFGAYTKHKNYCALGSVKSNIGHTLTASGIASVIKVLLCMKHKKLVPTIHYKTPNQHIDFDNSQFYVNTEYKDWEGINGKRIAAISSFGLSGTNCHMVIEQWDEQFQATSPSGKTHFIPFSAKNVTSLVQVMKKSIQWLNQEDVQLQDVEYTLQRCRTHFAFRSAFIVNNKEELIAQLKERIAQYEAGELGTYIAVKKRKNKELEELINNMNQQSAEEYIDSLVLLKEYYIQGENVEWDRLIGLDSCRKVSLPVYAFNGKSYWVQPAKKIAKASGLSTLIDENISTINQCVFKKRLTGNEFYLRDHIIGSNKMLPGAASIEMMRQAAQNAKKENVNKIQNLVWSRGVVVKDKDMDLNIMLREEERKVLCNVCDQASDNTKYCQGEISFGEYEVGKHYNIEKLISRFGDPVSAQICYERLEKSNLHYGPSFQVIRKIYEGNEEALGELQLDRSTEKMVLHPSIVDGAFQTTIGIISAQGGENNVPYIPYSVKEVLIYGELPAHVYVWVKKRNTLSSSTVRKFDICIMDENGNVLVEIKEYFVRALEQDSMKEILKQLADGKITLDEAKLLIRELL